MTLAPIPPELNSPAFTEAWALWLDHLKQKRKPPTTHAQDLQLRKLKAMGLERAISTILYCIEHNWQGIYERPQDSDRTNTGRASTIISTVPAGSPTNAERYLAGRGCGKAEPAHDAPGVDVAAKVARPGDNAL